MTRKELIALDFPKLTEERYEIRCQAVKDGLAIAFYQMHELVVRSFLSKENFINVVEETKNESKKVIDDLFYALPGCVNEKNFVISEQDAKSIADFTTNTGDIQGIIHFQRSFKNKKQMEKMASDLKKATAQVALVTRVPKNFDKWLEKQKTVFVHERKKKDKTATATCTICHGTWQTTKQGKEWDECPHCKAYGQYRRNRIRTYKCESFSGSFVGKNAAGQIVECVRKCFVTYENDYMVRKVEFIDGDRRFIPISNACYERYGSGYKKSYKLFNRQGDFFHPYTESSYVYPGNMKRIFKGTAYEKYEPEKMAKYMEKHHYTWFIGKFIEDMEEYPLAERVMKGGFRNMLYDMMLTYQYDIVDSYIRKYFTENEPNTSLAAAMGITKSQLNAIRESKKWQAEQIAIAAAVNLIQPETPMEVIKAYAELLVKNKSYYANLGNILNCNYMVTIPFVRYMKKFPEKKQHSFLSDYRDYIRWMEILDYRPTKTRLRPKDFQKAHDEMEKEHEAYLEAKKREQLRLENEYMKEIQPIVEQLLKLPLLNDNFEIVVPSCRKDLIEESENLHHCVRSYSSSIYNHNCVIVFIRKKDCLDESFYTMEITKKFNIQQCRTYKNDSYMLDKDMIPVIDKYAADIKKRASSKEFAPLIEKLQFQVAA